MDAVPGDGIDSHEYLVPRQKRELYSNNFRLKRNAVGSQETRFAVAYGG